MTQSSNLIVVDDLFKPIDNSEIVTPTKVRKFKDRRTGKTTYEAMEFNGLNAEDIIKWCEGAPYYISNDGKLIYRINNTSVEVGEYVMKIEHPKEGYSLLQYVALSQDYVDEMFIEVQPEEEEP